MNKKKKPLFSKKGNPDNYNYLSHQLLFIGIAIVFVLAIVFLSE